MDFKQIWTICKKELKYYFNSPIAYIVCILFYTTASWLFWTNFFFAKEASLRQFFGLLPWLFALSIPAVTMRSFAEELQTGSYEMLYTLPINLINIIGGKFLSVVFFIVVMMIPTLFYALSVSMVGDFEWGVFLASFFASIFLGMSYAAVGIFASSVTKNQIVALLLAMFICIGFFLVSNFIAVLPKSLAGIFFFFSTSLHFQNFTRGILDFRDVVYFLGFTLLFLSFSYRVLVQRYLSSY